MTKIKIPKTLKKDALKYLNYNIDLRNAEIKKFILEQNGLQKLQEELNIRPEYIKILKKRQSQKKYQSKIIEIKKDEEIKIKTIRKEAEVKIKKVLENFIIKRRKIKAEERRKIKEQRDKKVKQEIKNYIQDNYDIIRNLTKPDGIYKLYPLEFGEEYKILFVKEMLNAIKKVLSQGEFKSQIITDINLNGTNYTFHQKTFNTIINKLNGEVMEYNKESDLSFYFYSYIDPNEPIIFTSNLKTNKNDKKEGAFFKYYNKTNINLERYQITNGEYKDKENNINKDNCLVYALRILGLEEEKLLIIKKFVLDGKIPICKLKDLCIQIGIKINLITDRKTKTDNDKIRKKIYGIEGEIYNICCLDEHYFIYDEKTDYTSYYINNYNYLETKNIKNKNYIYRLSEKDGYKRDEKRTIDSYELISLLLENKEQLLEKIDYTNINLLDEPYKGFLIDEDESNFKTLEYNDKYSTKEYLKEDAKDEQNTPEIIIFDFETYTDKIHIPYLCCSIDSNNNKNEYYGEDCGEQLLKSLKNDTILMAHNAKYDMRFIIKYLNKCSEINNGSSFVTFSGYYGKIKVIIKDSYKLIASPLKNMPEMFLTKEQTKEIKKEVMPYDIYSKINLQKRYIDIDEINKHLKTDEDKEQFKNNAINWDLFYNNKVDILEYSAIYCRMDCKILKECYAVFREWCLNDFNLDINNILTIPSLAEKIFKNYGCFDGCYSLSGLPQLFISRCVVGGRTMMANNKKAKIENQILNDFDAVSLYPSAMARIKGFLKGIPKVIKTNNYNDIKNYDGYFVQIKILKVGIKRSFPLMSYKTIEGIRDFNNEMEDKIIIVDKITLEDLIEFQKIEFEILKGYYFDEGFNNKIVETIKYLFSKRLELKKQGNKSEVIYKLIMNAGYGKLITKPHETKIKFFDNETDFNIYKSRNYNIIYCYTEYTSGKFRVEINESKGNQYNYCHLGSEILSMSKRIMNEVICTAEDNNLNIYYQDTDSIHINDEDIKKLTEIYENKYNRNLIGKGMGQFHSDFDLKVEGIKIKNIVSTGLIMLGKKSYIDKLRGEDEENNYYYDYHIRLKGINKEAIELKIKQDYNNAYELYEDLYNGKKINFDLTAEGNKCCFEFGKTYTVSTRCEFKREVCF